MSVRRGGREGILAARPVENPQGAVAGLHPLGLDSTRDGLVYIPPRAAQTASPLIVMLHGSGANARDVLGLLEQAAEQEGCILLLPDARQYTWDVLVSGFGPDVQFLDRALAYVFARCRVDRSRLAIAGFSDGASYALTLGVANGVLFSHVMAFSPGFLAPRRLDDSPRIFISHGVSDTVLPIATCSRRIVAEMREWSYDVTYREFPGGHTVPANIRREAMGWFLEGRRPAP